MIGQGKETANRIDAAPLFMFNQMQFINAKQAYPMILGVILTLVGVGLWQRLNPPPIREIPESPPIIVPPLPDSLPRPSVIPGARQGSLRVGNRTDRPIRIVLLTKQGSKLAWNQTEPLNWDFAPSEGGTEGLQLSLPDRQVKISAGDLIFAFTTDGSRTYWGPNVVGDTDSPFWDDKRKEWSMVLQP